LDLPRQATLCTPSDVDALAQVLAWFEQFNHPAIPRSVWLQCQLSLSEGFTNAVRHAHQGNPIETAIDIEIRVSERCFELRIWDCRAGFDLNQTLNAMPPIQNQVTMGRRGLKLMQQIASCLSYTKTIDHCNCLLIIKQW
jgi:serine/threonine-protein kinase RsbW